MGQDTLKGNGEFFWAGGIEDTFIPQAGPRLRPLEEYELTQHYTQWRADLERAASLGITMLRWGVPWYRVEPQPGVFDWHWVDEVLDYMVNTLHIQPIIDLVHYGTPLWMTESFLDAHYPEHVAAYAEAFVQRYRGLVHLYTPLNEPMVNAEYSGVRGQWPPYLTGEHGLVSVLLPLAQGIQQTGWVIRRHDPEATLVAVEAINWSRARQEEDQQEALRLDRMNFLCWDLVAGRVDTEHPLYSWLIEHGATETQLARLRMQPLQQDILGVNFYPWSAQEIYHDEAGQVQQASVPQNGRLLAEVLQRCYQHTHCPLFVTETSATGSIENRQAWLRETIEAVHQAREQEIPVIGYTWFPLFSMIEWEYRLTEQSLADHLLHLGLWDITINDQQTLVRHETPLVEQYRDIIKQTQHIPVGRQSQNSQ